MPDDSLHQPHDKLFKAGFEKPAAARSFFEQHLPAKLFKAINWQSLKLENASFISPQLRGAESDLLYSASLAGQPEGSRCFLYILWEHSGRENHFALLNLLSYMVLIWKRYVEQRPQEKSLPPILPVLLAQNNRRWEVPEDFRQLFGGVEQTEVAEELEPYLVDFRARIVQLAEIGLGEIRGTPECVMVLRALKVAVSGDWSNELLWDEPLMRALGEELFKRLVRYVLGVSDLDKEEVMRILLRIADKELRSQSMSVAEQLIEEGRQKGRQEGLQKGLQKGRQEGRREGLQKGEWVGKIQLMEEFLGRAVTPREEFEGREVGWLQARFRELEREYNAKIKGR